MDDKELAWEEIETEHIVEDEWIDFRKSTYRYPDGRVFSPYYSYSRRDYTVIVASDGDGNYQLRSLYNRLWLKADSNGILYLGDTSLENDTGKKAVLRRTEP